MADSRQSEGIARFDELARTTPEQAASVILEGMAKGNKRILIGNDARLISLLARLFPRGYGTILARLFDMKV